MESRFLTALMRGAIKMIGSTAVLMLLTVHLALVSLLMAPAPKLLAMALEGEAEYLHPDEIPDTVADFIATNKIEVAGDYRLAENPLRQLIFRLIRIKRDHFMDTAEQLALDLNLLNYGEDVVGLNDAALFYYKKPLSELSDPEWLTLINLQKIFSKK